MSSASREAIYIKHGWNSWGSALQGTVAATLGEGSQARLWNAINLLLYCSRLDEDGKVLTPEELLYRVSRLLVFP